MSKRNLRFVKVDVPMIGICEFCNAQFKTHEERLDEARHDVERQFDAHECKPVDSSQNTVRIVKEATENETR
jgi:hypothetical protein